MTMKDFIAPILTDREPSLSYAERAARASEIIAERDKEEQTRKFDKNMQSFQVANQSTDTGAENRASVGLKR